MRNIPQEKIVSAAILQNGQIFTGIRHSLIIKDIVNTLNIDRVTGEQGFITESGFFVNREEAQILALKFGQIKNNVRILCSEDLWDINWNHYDR